MSTPAELTDDELDAIYSRSAFDRWSKPMQQDDLADVLSEAFTFMSHLGRDPGFRDGQRPIDLQRELYAMAIAHDVLLALWNGKRPRLDGLGVPLGFGWEKS